MNDECVLHECAVALLLIDVINDLEFEDGDKLSAAAVPAAGNIARLKLEAKINGVPCVYVNDNFGQWQSDFKHLISSCVRDGVRGAPIAKQLVPQRDDYFVLKPRHSGFFQTPLDLLLRDLHARKLILCGLTTDSCVLFTANDAYLRGFEILVPSDCSAAMTNSRHTTALGQMRRTLKAATIESTRIDFKKLLNQHK
ncbi:MULTISPECIES: isochorismatase family cysteine hydrolase [unclassified Nitrosospira]|uniref:isochorismatase family cysteine hydrolase n=1 Tax=unclassified Nitrosospira TaxID=2609267 RepID=UPI000D31B548|nr:MULTISPECIES: isochorismatase family cysteine hydrolase [unclassified Nitrosospira]PTR17033.1 nicotinamidase-related amidase [Nitrosospira sp. Nsp2]WON74610.1 isochorismatase family cysteine hydrolase [Nitrosospira sp. Is2]